MVSCDCGHEFEPIIEYRHKLICGDCTDAATVDRLMGGEKAAAMFADPPYNIEMKATSNNRDIQEIENDSMPDDEFALFLFSFMDAAKSYIAEDIYICCDWRKDYIFKESMKKVGWKVKTVIVWDKEVRAQNLNKWAFAHEFILYSGYMGAPTLDTNVWKFKREYSNVHLTPKPVELIKKAILATKSTCIYDPFIGTGSTMVACENVNKKCLSAEKDPKYVAVTLERMFDVFGIEGVLIE